MSRESLVGMHLKAFYGRPPESCPSENANRASFTDRSTDPKPDRESRRRVRFPTSAVRKNPPSFLLLRILTYFFAPEIYLHRFRALAITLEYLDSYKSLVTRAGFGGTPRERVLPFVTSTRVIGEKPHQQRLSEYSVRIRPNGAHEFKIGWKIPRPRRLNRPPRRG